MGKQAVPHHVLNRNGSLTEEEFRLVQNHVLESLAALRRMGYVDPQVLEIVGHHHEMWNGKGYPDGMAGEEIPLGARITGVAEAYSALTAWRPYREALDCARAMSELRTDVEKGRFEPGIVEALTDLLKGRGLPLSQ